ncbi:hypothetical protein ACS0TY_014597 [Phlomoides rotata]
MIWEEEEISRVFTEYFMTLFTTDGILEMSEAVDRKITGAPPVSHLFFADDSIIFGRANKREVSRLKSILNVYEKASGQVVNLGKSDICFSGGVPSARQDVLASLLGVNRVDQHQVYLGILTHMGRSKTAVFNSLASLLDEFSRAQTRGQLEDRPQRVAHAVWMPPNPGFVKINTDASFSTESDIGLGGVARDENGLMLWCFAEHERGQTDVDTAEALAALKGMELALAKNVRKLWVEVDSQILTDTFNMLKENLSSFGCVLIDFLAINLVLNF